MPQAIRDSLDAEREGACPRHIDGFLEPCLLLLVHCQEIHGYELADGLKPFGYLRNPVDASTIYRFLRSLEDRGFVQSRWDTSNAGPARRVYHTTEAGARYLATWVNDLRETDSVLHFFLDTYDRHMQGHELGALGQQSTLALDA
jgi:PadR family transcriptional regulator PadR